MVSQLTCCSLVSVIVRVSVSRLFSSASAACVLPKKDYCRALNAFCFCSLRNHVAVIHQVQIHRVVRGGGIARGDGVGHATVSADGLFDEVAVFLGGRVAEELMCDDITSGASNDLERATKMAREMVTRLGMSEELGTQVFGEAQHQVFLGRDYADHQDYSEETARRIDIEVQRIMREARSEERRVGKEC